MKFTQASLPGVWIIDVERHGDSRGYFAETFRAGEFERHVGAVDFVQENESMSRRGVVRGLHYQAGSSAQAKLVRVVDGTIVDVVVDLRRGSPAFGRHIAVELSAENGRQLFVPRAENTFNNKHTSFAEFESIRDQLLLVNGLSKSHSATGIRIGFLLAVEWPFSAVEAIVSQKDASAGSFEEAEFFD